MAQTEKSNGERRLAVTAIGPNKPSVALELIRHITKRDCQIKDCHITPMADSLSIALLIAGNWSSLGKLETALPKLAAELDLQILYRSSATHAAQLPDYRPYSAEIIAPVKKELITQVLDFFRDQNVIVNELVAQDYNSAHTGAAMCNMSLIVNIPTNQHPQTLREAYMDLCDALNADGMLDPIKT